MFDYYNEKAAAETIKRLFKGLNKRKETREDLYKTWIDDKGRQCACDGFRAYRLNKPIAGLPDAGKPVLALEKCFPALDDFRKAENVPSLDDLKALMDDDKAHTVKTRRGVPEYDDNQPRGLYFFQGDGAPAVNAEYLRDMLRLFPDAEIYWKANSFSPLYFKSANGDGILLPCRCDPALRPAGGCRPIPAPRMKERPAAPAFSLGQFAARYAM